jgi:hypothetical protein
LPGYSVHSKEPRVPPLHDGVSGCAGPFCWGFGWAVTFCQFTAPGTWILQPGFLTRLLMKALVRPARAESKGRVSRHARSSLPPTAGLLHTRHYTQGFDVGSGPPSGSPLTPPLQTDPPCASVRQLSTSGPPCPQNWRARALCSSVAREWEGDPRRTTGSARSNRRFADRASTAAADCDGEQSRPRGRAPPRDPAFQRKP